MSFSTERLTPILDKHRGRKGVLLQLLQEVQEEFGYVPQESIGPISKAMNMAPSLIYGTATFYSELRTQPPPNIEVEMCLGPTCHLQGAERIRAILKARMGLNDDWRTPDNNVGMHVVQCAGHCHLAPLLYVDGEVIANLKVADAAKFADGLLKRSSAEDSIRRT